MSVKDDLAAAAKELSDTKIKLSIAGGCLAASMAVAHTMKSAEVDVWRVVAAVQMTKITRNYAAAVLCVADQLNAELKVINDDDDTK